MGTISFEKSLSEIGSTCNRNWLYLLDWQLHLIGLIFANQSLCFFRFSISLIALFVSSSPSLIAMDTSLTIPVVS